MVEDDLPPESVREVAAEDFLFHLYRGSELLQDDRVHEAKQELEHALALQPRDPKGQDLLAIVYFRLGLYPRAITIYVDLLAAYPDALTPRINLALCYLKTGQPSAARSELELVVRKDPSHNRAWGYLGLAFQRLGDVERAVAAFQEGGHHGMAHRVGNVGHHNTAAPPSLSVAPPRGLTNPEREVVSRAATEAFDDLERQSDAFRAEASTTATGAPGTWAAVEPGREPNPIEPSRPSILPGLIPSLAPSDSLPPPSLNFSGASDAINPLDRPTPLAQEGVQPTLAPGGRLTETPAPSLSIPARAPMSRAFELPPISDDRPPATCFPALGAESFLRDNLIVFPRNHNVSIHKSGCVLIQVTSGVAARFDCVRVMGSSGTVSTKPLLKKARSGRDVEESLGSPASPLLTLENVSQLILGPPAGTKLSPVALADTVLTVRESAVIALEGDVTYENTRLAGGDGDFISMVQLRGSGAVVLALPGHASAIEISTPHTMLLRVHTVLGWVGRIASRSLAPSESPTKARGLVAIQGEGMVMIDGR